MENRTVIRLGIGPSTLRVSIFGEGPAVVLVPSLGRGCDDFALLAGALAEAGFRTVAIDPREIGESSGPLTGLTLHDYAADVAGVIEALECGPAHIVGHAFGNRVARCLAADRPDLVRSVTLIAAGGLVEPDPEAAAALRRCFQLDLPAAARIDAISTAFFAPGNDPTTWQDGWWPEAATAQSAATRATPRDDWWTAGRAPLLVIQGIDDRVAPPANGHALKQALGDRVTVIDLEGAGHALLPEQPDAIAEAIIPFLGEHTPAGAMPPPPPARPFGGMRIPISETMQAEIVSFGDGHSVLRYPVLEQFFNPRGQLQGGVYAVMMDSAMAIAAGGIATATMQFSIFRPVSSGWLTVKAEVVKSGRQIVYAEAEIRDDDGRLVARGNQNGIPRAAEPPPA